MIDYFTIYKTVFKTKIALIILKIWIFQIFEIRKIHISGLVRAILVLKTVLKMAQ